MMQQQKELWIDTRLNQEEMDYLHTAISEENKESFLNKLAGNISKSEKIKDKDNWFFKSVLKKLTERMFYRDWDNFSKYHIEVEEGIPLPEFEMNRFWVNYMKQHEFNPIHDHIGLYSFVIFMKIPTHWKEQHALPFSANSNEPRASDFEFVVGEANGQVYKTSFPLSPEDEGRMLFFPAWLQHQVFPFYGTEEERVTISGNIRLCVPNRSNEYEEKEKILKMLENSVEVTKEQLKWMKKEGVNDGKTLD